MTDLKTHMSGVYQMHAEIFGTAEQHETAKKLAQEKARSEAELAYRFANLSMPEDIRSRAKSWGMEAFCEMLWNAAFQAGFREANRNIDKEPPQLKGMNNETR